MNRRVKLLILGFFFAVCISSAWVQSYQQRQKAIHRPNDLFDVVWAQVQAFRSDDYESAYRQISNSFQEKFDMAAFADLARSDYPLLARAERVEFGAVQWNGHAATVPTYFFMAEGEVLPCLFSLVYERGAWKIDEVRVQKRWPAGRRLGGMRT
ncbi:DUF4864 domain-containing protein [Verrucomicrobiota bacterium sgz303538]